MIRITFFQGFDALGIATCIAIKYPAAAFTVFFAVLKLLAGHGRDGFTWFNNG